MYMYVVAKPVQRYSTLQKYHWDSLGRLLTSILMTSNLRFGSFWLLADVGR